MAEEVTPVVEPIEESQAPVEPTNIPVVDASEEAAPAPVEPTPLEEAPAPEEAPADEPAPAPKAKGKKALVPCAACDGSGLEGGNHPGATNLCEVCDGSGQVKA